MTLWLETLIRHRRLVIAATLGVVLALAPGLLRIQVDNSPAAFFLDDAELLGRYAAFQRDFGGDQLVRVVARGPSVWTGTGLAWQDELETRLRGIFSVGPTAGLASLHRWHLPEWPPPDPVDFRRSVLSDPIHRNASLVSESGDTTAIIVGLFRLGTEGTHEQLRLIEQALEELPPGVTAAVLGMPVVNRALDEALGELLIVLFPALSLVISALILAALRRAGDVARALAFVSVCEIVVHGAMGYAGVKMNVLVSAVAPILSVIGLATAVQVLLRLRSFSARGLTPGSAVVRTWSEKGWPIFWTTTSTLVAFGAFAVSALPSVRAFGTWCALGLAAMLLLAFSFYPALLAARAPDVASVRPYERVLAIVGRRVAEISIRRRRTVLGAFLLIAVVAAAGLPRLRVETNLLEFLRPGHPVRDMVESVEQSGLAVTGAELVLRLDSTAMAAGFRSPDGLSLLSVVSANVRADPAILGAISAGDLRDALERWQKMGGRNASLDELLADAPPDVRTVFDAMVTRDGRAARVTLQTRMRGFQELRPVLARAAVVAGRAVPGARAEITGQYPLVLEAQREMVPTMAAGLTASFVCIAVMFLIVTRSLKLAALVLIPNIWPAFLMVSVMAWLGVALDSVTVSVAAVSLGLAVDDTFHTLADLRRLASRLPSNEAMAAALEQTAPAHVLGSAALMAGFSILAFSRLVPISNFSAFLILSIAAALAADLVLLPALLGGRVLPAGFTKVPLESHQSSG